MTFEPANTLIVQQTDPVKPLTDAEWKKIEAYFSGKMLPYIPRVLTLR